MEWTNKLPTKSGWYGHITLYPIIVSIDCVIITEQKTIIFINNETFSPDYVKDDFWTNEPFKLPIIPNEIVKEIIRRRVEDNNE